ncbi:MAG TPA: archease [Candidatus Deferrimicrobium sp.]|nr:archease [Candidatus Deferrimicrobium sp.]
MTFRFLEHISDVYVEAIGRTLEEAFVQGAYAMFETMTDIKTIEAIENRKIEIEAEDLEALLFEWIDQFLYLFDVEGLMFSKFDIKIDKIVNGYRLNGLCWGEKFDPEKHPARTEIKAPTYSLMEIIQKPSKITLRFVMDI